MACGQTNNTVLVTDQQIPVADGEPANLGLRTELFAGARTTAAAADAVTDTVVPALSA